MLIGRTVERQRLRDLLGAAHEGRSGAVVLRGEPGIGLSSLIDEIAKDPRGALVLRVVGSETEREFAFSGLDALVHPILGRLDAIPAPQADALRGALALAEARGVGRLAIGAATLSLFAAASDDGPVLCLVDDADVLDQASADALVFAARRLEAEGIVMLFAAHDDAAFVAPGIDELRVGGLAHDDALVLVQRAEFELAPAVAERIVEATGGTPLALLAVPGLLTPAQRLGREPLPHPLPMTDELVRAYAQRAGMLSPQAQRALALVAAVDTGAMRVIDPAIDAAALREAEDADLISIESGRLAFPNPLFRSAAYHLVPAAERRQLHIEIAAAFGDDPRYRERRAFHLAAGTSGPDESVAEELLRAADAAAARRAHVAAAGLYERAARFSPSAPDRDARSILAARQAFLAGQLDRASTLLDALGEQDGPAVALLRAELALALGADRREVGLRLARSVEADQESAPADRAEALALAAHLADPAEASGFAQAAAALADAADDPRARILASVEVARAQLLAGDPAGDATLEEIHEALRTDHGLRSDPGVLFAVADAFELTPADTEHVDELLRDAEAAAREYSIGTLPAILLLRAWRCVARGTWDDATIAATEAGVLFDETGQRGRVAGSEALLAFLAANRGDSTACHDHLDRMQQVPGDADEERRATRDRVLGVEALAAGDPTIAIRRLEPVVDGPAPLIPSRALTTVDLVDAFARSGTADEAGAAAARIGDLREPLAPACAAWAAAIVSGDAAGFDPALEALDALAFDRPYVRARIELSRGERLRRDGERVRSREALRAALAIFERLGAEPWAARARIELAATGEKLQRRPKGPTEDLTPQELQVARLIASGDTYKEAATKLFLAPKTIEFHLGKVYRKLGIAGRRELVFALEAHERGDDG